MRLQLIVGCLVLSACAATPPAPAAKSGDAGATKVADKTPAKPVLTCENEPQRTGSIMAKRRCRPQEQSEAQREAAQDDHPKSTGPAAAEAGAN